MWPILLIFFGFVLGVGTGYKVVHRKIVPLVRFVEKSDREKTLEDHRIRLDETTKCSICGDNITLENIGAAVSTKDGNVFVCSKPQCMTVSDILTPIERVIEEKAQ